MKNNQPPIYKGLLKDPLRVVFGEGFDQMVCTPQALKTGAVPADIRPPAAEVKKALAALALNGR